MKHIATIKGQQYEITAQPYNPNETRSLVNFKRNMRNDLVKQWNSYNTAVDMLGFGSRCAGATAFDNPAQKAMRQAIATIRTAFMIKLMQYMLASETLDPNASSVDWSQYNGGLLVWSLDNNGNPIDGTEQHIIL